MSAYNGWKNYETWVVKLWLDNEEPSWRYWEERTKTVCTEAEDREFWTAEKDAAIQLSKELEDTIDEGMPEELQRQVDGTFYADLLNAALSEVDWREIADAMIEDHCAGYFAARAKEKATS